MHVKLFLPDPSHEYFEMMYLEQFRVCIDNFKYILFQYRLKKLDAFYEVEVFMAKKMFWQNYWNKINEFQ